jgi:hypothetical protein
MVTDLTGVPNRPLWHLNYRSAVSHIAFSPDSSLVALTSVEGNTTQVWEASNGRLVATLTHAEYEHPGERHNSVAISRSGRYLARGRRTRSRSGQQPPTGTRASGSETWGG